jgi:hypothetical protein
MYTLFNEPIWGTSGASVTFPKYLRATQGLRQNLEKVVQYNRTYPRAVESNHFLVKLLTSLNVPLSMDVNIYRDRVEEVAEGVSMAFNLTSSLYRGRVFSPGIFYGKGSSEIIIAHAEEFDIRNIEDEWEDYRPVTFLTHPKTDLGIDLPLGFQNGSEEGLSVILVNIPMLACQYRMWRIREWRENNEAQRTKMQFVSSYPLTNALYSQLDIAVLNRFQHIYRGEPRGVSMMRKPYTLTRWEQELDIGLDQYVDDLQKRNFTFDHFLSYIKGVSSWTMRDVIRIPAMVPTRQVTWALALARAELTDFLLDWNIECEVKANKAYCNTIQLETSRLLNDSIIKSMLPLSAQKPWDDLLRMIIAKAKSVR